MKESLSVRLSVFQFSQQQLMWSTSNLAPAFPRTPGSAMLTVKFFGRAVVEKASNIAFLHVTGCERSAAPGRFTAWGCPGFLGGVTELRRHFLHFHPHTIRAVEGSQMQQWLEWSDAKLRQGPTIVQKIVYFLIVTIRSQKYNKVEI